MLSYSQAEPGRELTQPRKHLLAEPCSCRGNADDILSNGVSSADIIASTPSKSTNSGAKMIRNNTKAVLYRDALKGGPQVL